MRAVASKSATELGQAAETLTTFRFRIQAAADRVNLPRETVARKKAATRKLVAAFGEADALLEAGIDPLVFPMRTTDLEFYEAYRAARSIVDLRGRRRALENTLPPAVALELVKPVKPVEVTSPESSGSAPGNQNLAA